MSEKAKQFRQWCSERMGHPFPIQLARLAIDELEDKNQQLAQDKAELVEALGILHQRLIEEGKRYGATTHRKAVAALLEKHR